MLFDDSEEFVALELELVTVPFGFVVSEEALVSKYTQASES